MNVTHFKHPIFEEPVVVFIDPRHALKLFRNCLAEYSSMVDDEDNLIQWRYFVKLNNLQEQEKLHLDLQLTEFAGCAPTIRATRLINDIFDILNTRSIKQFKFKQALHEGNKEYVFKKLDECFEYISKLRECKNGQFLINGRKKTVLSGF
ncbi:THAP domain-containing protein 9 [Temnothorax longispinosus]|uniref:THAP domain-containing protein 9 n=1 Tax=Temnothorax longispinosus TaxID=300112 RepID=A0A4S2KX90_9HYME|nr:THAP domain-containing protein 9 [Temnothorax longispinosus]